MSMIEVEGTFEQMANKCLSNKHIDAIVVNSNNVIKANGKATLPFEVYMTIPHIFYLTKDEDGSHPKELKCEIRERMARLLKATARHQTRLLGRYRGKEIISFPTKNNWRDPEDLALIEREAKRFVKGLNKRGWKFVAMMRPIEDESIWASFKEKFEAILNETNCKVGVFSGIPAKVEEPKPEPKAKKKKVKDMTEEEKKEYYKARAAKAAKTRAANKKKKEREALMKEQEQRVKDMEDAIADQLNELDK